MPRVFMAVLLAGILLPDMSIAQAVCVPRSELAIDLQERYGEAAVALGVTSGGAVVELWASGEGESWTIVVTVPSGAACVIAAGEDWQSIVPAPGRPL